jgi:hypothetical protein
MQVATDTKCHRFRPYVFQSAPLPSLPSCLTYFAGTYFPLVRRRRCRLSLRGIACSSGMTAGGAYGHQVWNHGADLSVESAIALRYQSAVMAGKT